MLGDNLKTFRKTRGLTQEELAARLHVVRQTVSKWEKGVSVPDADMLQKIAELLEVDVTALLGPAAESETREQGNDALVQQLSRLNEQLAVKNRRARRIWKTVGIVLLGILALQILLILFNMVGIGAPDMWR